MGTTTMYLRHNDLSGRLSKMTKSELDKIDNLSPYKEGNSVSGWRSSFELHNGNVYPLVFWKGRLMKLEEAPSKLNQKYYNRLSGKTLKEYEWTILKRLLLCEIERLDKEFKKSLRSKKKRLIQNFHKPENMPCHTT